MINHEGNTPIVITTITFLCVGPMFLPWALCQALPKVAFRRVFSSMNVALSFGNLLLPTQIFQRGLRLPKLVKLVDKSFTYLPARLTLTTRRLSTRDTVYSGMEAA